MLLLYIPDRSKQHTRRFPAASVAQALSIRRARVSARLAEAIQGIQSLRAMGLMSDHSARAFGAAARAFRAQPVEQLWTATLRGGVHRGPSIEGRNIAQGHQDFDRTSLPGYSFDQATPFECDDHVVH